eukprot:4079866-Alexandrium_andersonii.AAC.1
MLPAFFVLAQSSTRARAVAASFIACASCARMRMKAHSARAICVRACRVWVRIHAVRGRPFSAHASLGFE